MGLASRAARRRAKHLALVAWLAGCCPTPAPTPAAPLASAPEPAVTQTIDASPPPIARADVPAPGKCLGPEPGGFVPTADELVTPRCRPNADAERQVRSALLKAYRKTWDHSTVEVSFTCDPIAKPLRFIASESTDPRFYQLRLLWRDGSTFRALEARWVRKPKLKDQPAPRRWFIRRGSVPAATVDALHARLRAYMSARIREVEAEAPGFERGHGRLSSDPPEVLYLEGAAGGRAERRYSGNESSDNQGETLPYRGALALLRPALESVSGDEQTLTPAEIRAVAEWSWSLRTEPSGGYAESTGWRAAKLAEISNSRQLVPLLLYAIDQDAALSRPTDESVVRALATLTGLDLRKAPDGTLRDPAALAQAYYDGCALLYGLREGSPE